MKRLLRTINSLPGCLLACSGSSFDFFCMKLIQIDLRTKIRLRGTSRNVRKKVEDSSAAVLKICQKAAANNDQFSHWLPKQLNCSSQGVGKTCQEQQYTQTDGLYFSPGTVYTMTGRLNNSSGEYQLARAGFSDLSSLFNSPYQNNRCLLSSNAKIIPD